MAHECPLDGSSAFGFRSCYWHLKEQALHRNRLADAELDFIGVAEESSSTNGAGWRSVDALVTYDLGGLLSPEDTELMQAVPPMDAQLVCRQRVGARAQVRCWQCSEEFLSEPNDDLAVVHL